jgi:folylpolyglutamate synthase/dihydropteroate synthase
VITEYNTITAALKGAQELAGPDDRIVAFGSFITVAEAMRELASRR